VGWPSASVRENVIFTDVQLSKDDTPGCTKDACNFRDANHLLQQRGVVVLGVSADDVPSHQKFAEKYGPPFPLLSDTEAILLSGSASEKRCINYRILCHRFV
jgi:peroxiredoxin